MSEPDLFVVCKNCSSEVSPYVTECPYCGQRVRKRAPKLERGTRTEPRRPRGARGPRLPRLRRDEIPGIAPETRPVATIVLIVASLAATIVAASGEVSLFDMGAIFVPIGDEWWRVAATPFLHDNAGYQFVALTAVGIFGMHIERRFGWLAAGAVFLLSGAGGAALSVALDVFPVLGANGAALGLLCAWFVDDRLAYRSGEDRENDLLGVYVIAALLVLLSAAEEDASIAAAAGGAATGAVLGALLSPLRR
jgi:membrane associated rhomboid family serine protease